jgi:hypothetical protein
MNTDLKNYIKESNKKIFENHLQKNQGFAVAKINLEFNNDVVDENEYDTESDISDSDSDYFLIDLDSINNEKPKKIVKKTKNTKLSEHENDSSENNIKKYKSIKKNVYISSIVNLGVGLIVITYISYKLFFTNTKYKI